MNLKEIDFKQLLIEKGERIGLIVAAVVTVLLVAGAGLAIALNVTSPSKNSATLKDLRGKAEMAWQQSKPPDGLERLPDDLQTAEVKPVQSEWYACPNSLFVTLEGADTKWRLPKVMAPDEFQVDLLRGAFEIYMISVDPKDAKNTKIAILVKKASTELSDADKKRKEDFDKRYRSDKVNKRLAATQRLQEALAKRQGQGAGVPGAVTPGAPGAGVPGRGTPGGGKGGGMAGRGGFPGSDFLNAPNAQGSKDEGQEIKWVSVDNLAKESGKLAETNLPARMLVVSAAFPYKDQLDEYVRALRFGSVDEMLQDETLRPEFTGFNVERRTFGPDGQLVEDWAPLDLETPLKYIRTRVKELEPEDPKLIEDEIIPPINRVVIPRPKLAHDGKYPELKLASIQQAVDKMEEALKENAPPPPKQKSQFEDVDIFDVGTSTPAQGGAGNGPTAVAPAGKGLRGAPLPGRAPAGAQERRGGQGSDASPSPQRGIAVPDKVLVRFMDVAVFPGFSYEYRIQIRMSNPTHKRPERAVSKELAKERELFGPFQDIVMKTEDKEVRRFNIPDEMLDYGLDEKTVAKDKVTVQIHRWLLTAQAKWNQRGSEVPVGDWSILEKRQVARGEYLGEIKEVEVATWNPTEERYNLAVNPDEQIKRKVAGGGTRTRTLKHKGIAIDFATDPVYFTKPLLVDFDGGEHVMLSEDKNKPAIKEHGPVEMLILDASGKLIVRNSRADTENKERKERFDAWKAWIEQVKNQEAEGKDNPGRNLFESGKPGAGKRPEGGRSSQ